MSAVGSGLLSERDAFVVKAERPPPRIRATAEFEVVVDAEWVDLVTHDTELFRGACGRWLRGVSRSAQRGWLAMETTFSRMPFGGEPGRKVAIARWDSGMGLPAQWHALNTDLAIRAWIEGVKMHGTEWFRGPHGNVQTCDRVVQQALFGEIRYL